MSRIFAWNAWRTLAAQDLRIRVVDSRLGLAWLVLQPLLYLALSGAVFFGALGVRFSGAGLWDYLGSTLAGLIVWLAFNESLGKAGPVLHERAALLRNTGVPRMLLPLVPLAAALGYQLVGVCVLGAIAAGRGTFSLAMVQLVPAMLIELVLLAGLAWLVAAASALYRDVQYLIVFTLMGLLYLTPIFYPIEAVPEALAPILVELNPLAQLAEIFRAAVAGDLVALPRWGALAAPSVAVFAAGRFVFTRLEDAIADLV